MEKLVIFDMDGTLVDSENSIIRCMTEASSKFGYSIKFLKQNIGVHKLDDILKINGVNDRDIKEIMNSYIECYLNTFNLDTRPYNKSLETLEYLQMNNTLGVLTLKYENLTKKLLQFFFKNIDFKYIIGGTSISNKTQGLKKIIEISRIDRSMIYYVGDRGSDMEAAYEAGINGIWASFGLGKKDTFPKDFKFYVIDSFDKLIEILGNN